MTTALTLYCDDGLVFLTVLDQKDLDEAWFQQWIDDRVEALYMLGVQQVHLISKQSHFICDLILEEEKRYDRHDTTH
jgi:hypothetical protein